MKIVIPRERANGETRVAATPETVQKLTASGYKLKVETDVGKASGFQNEDYYKAGAEIAERAEDLYAEDAIILKIRPPLDNEESLLHKGHILVANFQAYPYGESLKRLAKREISAVALDKIPRIARAQSMDVLSSQSSLNGYAAVLTAANLLPRAIPLMMTAAGTVTPARVLVLGAGVAGLQAIATAKRLGAQVAGFDVRAEVREQVESLGAKFIQVKAENNQNGVYAGKTSAEYQKQQRLLIAEQMTNSDIVITTALIPRQKAPILIKRDMLEQLPLQAVVFDMAAAWGGNVEGVEEQKIIKYGKITLVGDSYPAVRIPETASRLWANNVYNLLAATKLDEEDELIKQMMVVKDGKVIV